MGRLLKSILILFGASCWYWFKYLYAYVIFGIDKYRAMPVDTRQWLTTLSVLALCLLITAILSSFNIRKSVNLLGLDKNIPVALSAAVLCTIPMFAGGYLYAQPNQGFGLSSAIEMAIWPGFTEEMVFRGFITGLLVREARWHIVPAILISAVLFAWGHLHQADNINEAILVFFVTSGAGIGFAVFYKMWGWNLWFPMFMHIMMNLSFAMFHTGDNVLLDSKANIFRGITIVLAIIVSIFIMYRTKKINNQQTV